MNREYIHVGCLDLPLEENGQITQVLTGSVVFDAEQPPFVPYATSIETISGAAASFGDSANWQTGTNQALART